MRRPSVILAIALWSGILLGSKLGSHLLGVVMPLIAISAGLALVRRTLPHLILLTLAFFGLGLLRSPESRWNIPKALPFMDVEQKIPVVLDVEVPFLVADCSDQIQAEVNGVIVGYPGLAGRRVILRGLEHTARPRNGRMRILGSFRVAPKRLNPLGVDRFRNCLRQGVVGYVDVGSIGSGKNSGGPSAVFGFRRRLAALIRGSASPETCGMLEALLLGRRSNIDSRIGTLMIKGGTYHVLAISGLHVGIVVLLLSAVLSPLGLGRVGRIGLAVGCVLCYVIFTGGRPSAQRAWTFFLLLSVCRLLQWKVDYPNCVCGAGTILLLAFPYLAWDVGFKLSIGAVFGITLLVPQLARAGGQRRSIGAKLRHYTLTGLLASFSAQVFTLPILLYHFGRVSVLGPVSNLVVLPLVTLIVAAGLEALLAMPFWMGLARAFMCGASGFVWFVFRLTELMTGLFDPLVFAGRPPIWKLVVYCALLAHVTLVTRDINRWLKFLILLLLCAFLIISPGRAKDAPLVVTFLYVGDGDACLIEMPNGASMLIDAGGCSMEFDAGQAYVLPLFAMKGLKRIDTAIITHSHNDHYGGFASLMESVGIGRFLVGVPEGESGYIKVLADAQRRGIEVRAVGCGDTLCWGEVSVEVFHPRADVRWEAGVDPNAQSVVCKLKYRSISILFTGDLTPSVQKALVQSDADLRCDILKVPHHGAPAGVDSAFAAVVKARYAVVSVGSRFPSHPSPETLDLLEHYGMRNLTTISDGAVTVTSDGYSLRVDTERGGVTPPLHPQ
jgi:competence protein ComEC